MSTILSAILPRDSVGERLPQTMGAALKGWWIAYVNWRMEQMAISRLHVHERPRTQGHGRIPRTDRVRSQRRDCASPDIQPLLLKITGRKGATPMNVNMVYPPRPARRGRVIALHCSGSGASQWRYLAEGLGGRYEVSAPEHYGCESTGPWTGEHAFTLADEAAQAIALIDRSDDKVHLVGHSYGGGVALNVALARPDRIASMALYEPSAFHLLRQMGERGAEPYAEITGVARLICQGVVTGDYRSAVSAFVDYWNGPGSWNALRPAVQSCPDALGAKGTARLPRVDR